MSSIRYIPEIDTLVVRVGAEVTSIVTYVPISEDVEIGIDENGRIVEFRVSTASRKGLSAALEALRRWYRRIR